LHSSDDKTYQEQATIFNSQMLDHSSEVVPGELLLDIIRHARLTDTLKRRYFYATKPNYANDALRDQFIYALESDMATKKLLSIKGPRWAETKIDANTLHALLGLITEVGELLEETVEALQNDRPLNPTQVFEEIGDIEWYLALMRNQFGWSQTEVQQANIAKLSVRYDGGKNLTKGHDTANRDRALERAALKSKIDNP